MLTNMVKCDNIFNIESDADMERKYFFNSFTYFTILSMITLLIWNYKLDFIGIGVFVLIIFFILLFKSNTIHIVPFVFNMLFMISQTEWSLENIPIYMYSLPVVLSLGFFIHFIKFRKTREDTIKGALTKPLLLMFIGMVLSIINTSIFDMNFVFYLSIGSFYVIIYLFFVKTIRGENLDYLLRLFLVLGLLISSQVLIYYLNTGDVADALLTKKIDLGWGISNFIATYLIIFITSTMYYIKTKPLKIIPIIIVFFEIIMLLFTLSRGGVLSFVVIIPVLIFYLYKGQKNKVVMTLYLFGLGALLVSVFIVKSDYFIPLIERFKNLELDNGSGRVELWIQAFNKFLEYPLFGAGLFARVEGDYFGFYHNTFLHTLASLGMVGFISLIWQLVVVMIIFIKKLNLKTSVLFIALVGANLHGMVDNVYFMPQFMILFFIILAVVEIYNHNQTMKPRIWRLEDVEK